MSIDYTDSEFVGNSSKSIVYNLSSSDIDLLNYSAEKSETTSNSESDKSFVNLDLLLKPCEIDRLVRGSSYEDECASLSSSCGVAKKPAFYIKQDMKTVTKSRVRKYHDDSDCVLETLLPKVPSRCTNKFSSHNLLKKDFDRNLNEENQMFLCEGSNNFQLDTEEEFSADEGSKNKRESSHNLLSNVKNQTNNNCDNSCMMKEDLLSDEWLCSLNPRVFCKKKNNSDRSPTPEELSIGKESILLNNVKLSTLNDLTQPFYRFQRKVTERELEKDLNSMGFSDSAEVNWNALYCPRRRDVLRLIHYRLCNHISPDIVVLLDDKEFFCHRILLQSYSEYFDDLKNTDSSNRIDITNMNITENAFLTIYTWMLTVGQGGFQLLTKKNILEVLLACQTLRIKDFENQCLSFLENEDIFNEDVAYFIYQNAFNLKMKNIQESMAPRIKNFFMILVSSKDYLELNFESVVAFLQSDNIAVHCELEVFFSAVRWLKHSMTERTQYVNKIMSYVRFGLMTPLELVDIRKTEQVDIAEIVTNLAVQRLIDEGLALAVKNTLGKGKDDLKSYYPNEISPRNWLGTPKSYKTYQEFLEYLKVIKKNPDVILHIDSRDTYHSEASDYTQKKKKELYLQISEKSQSGGSLTQPDSGITSMTPSNEAKLNQNSLKTYKNESLDVSTNTCLQFETYNLTPTFIKDLINRRSNEEFDEDPIRRPEAKISEPVILTRVYSRPRLREQAAIVIQAAFRGHSTRLRLLEAFSTPSRQQSRLKMEQSNEALSSLKSIAEPSKRSLSHVTISHLNSETKLQEELTKNGSTFHLFQNSILVFGGLDPTNNLSQINSCCTVFRFLSDKNKWEVFGNLPEPRYYHDVAILKGRVYLAGGVDPKREDLEERAVCKSVWSMDAATGKWQRETDMQTERKNFGLIAAGGYLYAIGGHNNESIVLSSVERYDPILKKWTYVASLEYGRTGAAICKHNHMIWVAGGIAAPLKHQVIKQVECYDPKRDVWMSKSPLRFGRAFGRLVSSRGNLYLVGGASKKSSTAATSTPAIDIWDERNKEWKLKTEMSIPRHNHSVAFVGDQMVILGGTTTLSMRCVTTIESWCVSRGSWVRGIASLPAPLIGHSTVTLPLDVP